MWPGACRLPGSLKAFGHATIRIMSSSLLQILNNGLAQMPLSLSAQVAQKNIDYIRLLERWNRCFNLTAVRAPADMVVKHLLDSLAVLPYVGDGLVVDVGSGAGLPGIPLALARPRQRFVLVDTHGKKTRFMQQAKIELGLDNVEVVHSRIEAYDPEGGADVVIARAYADTDTILRSTQHLHRRQTRILVMQGKKDTRLSRPGYRLKAVHALTVPGLEAERHLLEIEPVSP